MAKVITHEEVNALISGVFPSDPKKAVLYGDLSSDERFVINANNSVTNTPYTATQALLDADIRVRGSLTLTISPASATVLSTATQMVFNITTGGTGTITDWTVVSATIGGVDRKANTTFNAAHTQVTMTIPANTSYDSKTGIVQISVTTNDGTFNSNLAQCTQNANSRLVFNNTTSSPSSTDTGMTQALTNNNCTNVGVQSKSTGVSATISGNNVSITFPQNTGNTTVTRTVTVSGKTADGQTITTTHTMTQQAAVSTDMSFSYDGNNLGSGSGSIPASDFTLTLTNATLTNVSQTGGLTVVTGGTAASPTIRVSAYPANASDNPKEYTITLTATDVYGRTITKTVTITQNADTYTFDIQPNPNSVGALDTNATFTVTSSNISNIGIGAYDPDITGRTYNNGTLIAEFSPNDGDTTRTMEISLTGTTVAGRTITKTVSVSQSGGGEATLNIVYNGGTTRVTQAGLDTSDFTITANNVTVTGYSATNNASIVASGATSVTVRIPRNTSNNEKTYKVIVSGTSQYDGTTVSAETTVYQSSDAYTFRLTAAENPIAASATTTVFNITKANVSGITYHPTTSTNMTGATIGTDTATAEGISPNTGYSNKTIRLVLRGTTAGGRTVEASASTIQSYSMSSFAFESDFSKEWDAESAVITFTYDYLMQNPGEVSLAATGGAYFNAGLTQATSSTTITRNAANQTGQITIYFAKNQTSSPKTYTVTATGNIGQAGETARLESTITITHNVSGSASITVTPDSGSLLASATTATFQIEWSNLSTSNQITITTTGITGGAASFTPSTASGNATINATIAKNTGSSAKSITLKASGVPVAGGSNVEDTGSYTQAKSPSRIVVTRKNPTTSEIAYNRDSVTFNVKWDDVYGTINLTLESGSGTLSKTSISASGSNNEDITVSSIPENTGTSEIRIQLRAASTGIAGENVSDYHYYDQQVNTSNYKFTIEYTGSTVGSSAGSTNNFKITTENATVTGYTVDNGASVASSGTSSVNISYPANQNENTSVTYTVTMKGRTTFGNDVTTTCTFKQYADSYTFTVVANTNPVAATATNTTFRVNYSYISNPGYYAATSQNINSCGTVGASGSNVQVGISANQSTSPKNIILVLSGVTDGGRTVYATGTTQQSGQSYSPDIWWTDTSGGQTEITSVNVGSYVPDTYDGGNVSVVVYIEHNEDVNSVNMDTSSLINGATATRNGKTVTITAPANSGTSRSLGSIVITGTAPDGQTSDSETLTVTQSAGVTPSLLIQGQTTYTVNNLPSSGGTNSYSKTSSYVGNIGYSGKTGNITAITINANNIVVGISANTIQSTVNCNFDLTGVTVYGETIKAYFRGTQEAYVPPVATKNIWIKPNTTTVYVDLGLARPTQLTNFRVEINDTTGYALSCSGNLGSSGNLNATVPGLTGNTTYTISLGSWSTTTGTDWDEWSKKTYISWKENGTSKSYIVDTNSGITTSITVTQDTELSDFSVRLELVHDTSKAILRFKDVPITIYNKSSSVTHGVGTANIIFDYGNYYYGGSNSIQPDSSVTRNASVVPASAESSSNITLNLTYIYLDMTTSPASSMPDFGILKIKDLSGSEVQIQVPIEVSGQSYRLYWHGTQAVGTVYLGSSVQYDPSYTTSEGIVFEVDTDSLVPFLALGAGTTVPASGGTRTIQASWGNLTDSGVTFWASPTSAVTSGPTPSVAPGAAGQQGVSITIGANSGDDSRTIYLYASGKTYTQSTLTADSYITQPPTEMITSLSPTSIIWGNAGDETTIIFKANSPTTAITFNWNATLQIPSMVVNSGAKVSGQTSATFTTGQTLIPSSGSEFSGATVEIVADTHIPAGDSSQGSHSGNITIVAHGPNGQVKTYQIVCDS